MKNETKYNDLGDTLDSMGLINCVYVVKADGAIVCRTDSFSDALRELNKWSRIVDNSSPNMGQKCSLEVLL